MQSLNILISQPAPFHPGLSMWSSVFFYASLNFIQYADSFYNVDFLW